MKRVTFLLGSGVSVPAGMPAVRQITENVLCPRGLVGPGSDGIWRIDGALRFGGEARSMHALDLLSRLRRLCQDHYRSVRRDDAVNYEDLAYVAQQIADSSVEYENPAVRPLLRSLRRSGKFENLGEVAKDAVCYLKCVVSHQLSRQPNVGPLAVFVELAKRLGDELRIATLNHDLVLETLFRNHSLDYDDGFGPGENCRVWVDFNRSPGMKLAKLHGGINWWLVGIPAGPDQVLVTNNYIYDVLPAVGGEWVLEYAPHFLMGTFNKMLDYSGRPFSDLHYAWRTWLRESSRLVCIGYGFRDKGINRVIVDWLSSRHEHRLVVVTPNVSQTLGSARGAVRSAASRYKDRMYLLDFGIEALATDQLMDAIR